MDMHTHFLRPGTKIMTFVNQRNAVGKAGWNPALADKEQTIDDLMFTNYLKEIYLDSDTKVACISGAPSEVPEDWFLTNDMKAQARADVNGLAEEQAHVLARDLHARLRRLDGTDRLRDRRSQAGLDEGLHDRRQHQQEPVQAPVAHGRREARLPGVREIPEGGTQERLRSQGSVPAVGREAVPAPARVLGCARRRQGRERLAAAQLHHLSRRLSLRRRRQRRGRVGAVREDRAHRVDHRSVGDSREVRRDQRLRRRRPAVRAVDDRRSARFGGHDRPADQGSGRRSRVLGHRCDLDRLAAMADRSAAAPGDSRGPAEEIRAAAARRSRRSGQDGDLRRQQCAAVRLQAAAARGARQRSARGLQGALREARRADAPTSLTDTR